jgi:hypothetical protein
MLPLVAEWWHKSIYESITPLTQVRCAQEREVITPQAPVPRSPVGLLDVRLLRRAAIQIKYGDDAGCGTQKKPWWYTRTGRPCVAAIFMRPNLDQLPTQRPFQADNPVKGYQTDGRPCCGDPFSATAWLWAEPGGGILLWGGVPHLPPLAPFRPCKLAGSPSYDQPSGYTYPKIACGAPKPPVVLQWFSKRRFASFPHCSYM